MIEYPKKILVATDGTEDSIRAARISVSLAASSGAELHVVHVGQRAPQTAGAPAARPPVSSEPSGYAEKQARKLLDGQVEVIRSIGGEVSEAHLRMGQPAVEVVALAGELGADLLVVGSGGPRPLRRAVAATTRQAAMGRASGVIVRGAPCPVLVARGGDLPDV
jgi:nucleotide-binding universal stress UspA family protein